MSDSLKTAIRELRFLDDQRKVRALSLEEEIRWRTLKAMVSGAPSSEAAAEPIAVPLGFDFQAQPHWGPDGAYYPPGFDMATGAWTDPAYEQAYASGYVWDAAQQNWVSLYPETPVPAPEPSPAAPPPLKRETPPPLRRSTGTTAAVPPAPSPSPDPTSLAPKKRAPTPTAKDLVQGEHRVVIHTLEGQVKRGTVRDVALDSEVLPLHVVPGQPPERLPTKRLKAVFFLLPPGARPPPAEGQKLWVTFHDERQVAGFAPAYRPNDYGFFMFPADTRTNNARIYVYRDAVKSLAAG